MVHAATNRYHGIKWKAEMRWLAGAGAPVNLNDFILGSMPREIFSLYASLFVVVFPDGGLEQFAHFLLTQ